jgi:quercetin dioxygenase-like cupin family protein
VQILQKQPTIKGPPQWFTGDVHLNVIARGQEPSRLRVNTVRFAPGARTAWHTHAYGQILHVTEGICLTQSRGREVAVLRPGDAVWASPGEWHWHGAAPDQFMAHTVIWDGDPDGEETTWGELVTDEEYGYPDGQQPT